MALAGRLGRDPFDVVGCVCECWLPDTYLRHLCMCVSRTWARHIRTLDHTINVSALTMTGSARTGDQIIRRVLSPTNIVEVRLHWLVRITDDALSPLKTQPCLRVLAVTYCTNLTLGLKGHLPPSVQELRVAGCHQLYDQLPALEERFTLDVHTCAGGTREVEQQALRGFRFVDHALRAGIRSGPLHTCMCCGTPAQAAQQRACATLPDARGKRHEPELWHASSFDWCSRDAWASVKEPL